MPTSLSVPTLPESVTQAVSCLEAAGYEAYVVGGCVRDCVRGAAPHDFDITTGALPEETEEVFAGCRVIETGIKHGTVTVMIDGEPLEITTFRTDGEYSDARHPDSVSFTRSLEEDLARRDFTVNAIAYSPSRGFSDPFGGINDISAGVLRAAGEPSKRFHEDALRVMRGVRFSSVLGYDIEPATAAAMRECAPLLDKVSGERIFVELKKLLCGEKCGDILREYPDILEYAVPGIEKMRGFEQRHPYHVYDVLEHTIRVVENVPAEPVMRLAALLHDYGKPDCMTEDEDGVRHFRGHAKYSVMHAESIFERMRADRETHDAVIELIIHHDSKIPPSKPAIRRWLGKMGETQLRRLYALKRADVLAQNPAEPYILRLDDIDRSLRLLGEVITDGDCVRISDLAIGGRDLMAIGYEPGPEMGRVLNTLLNRVTEGEVPNERSALLSEAAGLTGGGE